MNLEDCDFASNKFWLIKNKSNSIPHIKVGNGDTLYTSQDKTEEITKVLTQDMHDQSTENLVAISIYHNTNALLNTDIRGLKN